ncbi:MAG: response regulator [Thermodesulfobacteriota bacterium]
MAGVLVISSESRLAEAIRQRLDEWGLASWAAADPSEAVAQLARRRAAVVILDIRRLGDEAAAAALAALTRALGKGEIIVLNTADNVRASMVAMQAGAVDEVMAPFETGQLRQKVLEAQARVDRQRRPRRSLWRMFNQAMAAATFAQAGESDTARELLDAFDTGPATAAQGSGQGRPGSARKSSRGDKP